MTEANKAVETKKIEEVKKVEPKAVEKKVAPSLKEMLEEAEKELRSVKRERGGLNREVKELKEQLEIANQKAEVMFNQKKLVEQKLSKELADNKMAGNILKDAIENAFNAHALMTHK